MDRRDFLRTCAAGTSALALGPRVAHGAPHHPPAPAPDRMAWWRDARFGMFIHFGLYSEPGGEWNGRATGSHEWMRHNAKIPHEEYARLADAFNPTAFDADAWVRTAKAAGQQYVVFTTKHHEGFALFDSAVSRHTAMHTPFRRDLCAELARACRRHDMKLGWYYSIMDWHHPDYLPRRDWEQRDATGADFGRYVAFMKAQLHELLTHYGDIAVLWFDGQWEHSWTHAAALELEAFCRRLMPGVVINDRIDVAVPADAPAGYRRAGDYVTPELAIPERGLPGQDWEACMTMNSNWGYAKDDQAYKPAPALLQLLAETASKGGNLLLNVGPDGSGRFPRPCVEALGAMGAWLRTNGAAIYGTQGVLFDRAPYRPGDATPPLVRATRGARTLHLLLDRWRGGALVLPDVRQAPRSARVLGADGVPVEWERTPEGLTITLADRGPNATLPVVQLRFDSALRIGG